MRSLRYSVLGLLLAMLLVPLVSSAQSISDIQAQVQQLLTQIRELQRQILTLRAGATTSPASSAPAYGVRHRICLTAQNLEEGDENDQVRGLQEFLGSQGLFNAIPTGFFGPVTREALRRWQSQSGILSGSEASDGSVFGPRSRDFLARWCSTTGTSGTVSTSTTPGNLPPTITSFSGPASLSVNQTGTWTVTASDPENGTLTYHVAWGDAGSGASTLIDLAGIDVSQFTSSTTFTYAYNRGGFFAVTLRVRDNAGGITATTRLVKVGATSTAQDDDDEDSDEEGEDGEEDRWAKLRELVADPEKLRQDIYTGGCWFTGALGEKCMTPKQSDGSCWFYGTSVKNGSWIVAYEKSSVPGVTYNQPCKMEVRTCEDGVLNGSYVAKSCVAQDEERASQNP